MKRLLIALSLISAFALYASAQSAVTVFAKEGEKFWLIVNGIKQNTDPQTNVQITGLTDASYKLKVIFQDENLPSIDKTVYTRDSDGKYWDASYQIKKNKQGAYVVNMVSAGEAASSSGYTAPLALEENKSTSDQQSGGTQTQTQTVTTTTTSDPNAGGISINVDDPEGSTSFNMSVGTTQQGTQTTTTVITTTTTTDQNLTIDQQNQNTYDPVVSQPDHYVMQGYNGKIGCGWPMAEADFNNARQSVAGQSFDETRLTVAKQVASSNCFTAQQVKDMMETFSFEDSKIEFAKFAYDHTYDLGNYYKVNDAFDFSSSVDELNDYLSTKR